jgi:hypothetical protein
VCVGGGSSTHRHDPHRELPSHPSPWHLHSQPSGCHGSRPSSLHTQNTLTHVRARALARTHTYRCHLSSSPRVRRPSSDPCRLVRCGVKFSVGKSRVKIRYEKHGRTLLTFTLLLTALQATAAQQLPRTATYSDPFGGARAQVLCVCVCVREREREREREILLGGSRAQVLCVCVCVCVIPSGVRVRRYLSLSVSLPASLPASLPFESLWPPGHAQTQHHETPRAHVRARTHTPRHH